MRFKATDDDRWVIKGLLPLRLLPVYLLAVAVICLPWVFVMDPIWVLVFGSCGAVASIAGGRIGARWRERRRTGAA